MRQTLNEHFLKLALAVISFFIFFCFGQIENSLPGQS